MDAFKIPQNIPQDLLLIHDIIGVSVPEYILASAKSQKPLDLSEDDCIDSSDSDNASEDEIEADLIPIHEEDEGHKSAHVHHKILFLA